MHGLGHWDRIAADERLGLKEKLASVVGAVGVVGGSEGQGGRSEG